MNKIFSAIISSLLKGRLGGVLFALFATTNLWAQSFQYGELYYNITSSSEPYTVEVGSAESSITSVIIPETVTYEGTTYSVTSIGVEAFLGCESLTSVIIPNSVTSIGDWAFNNCYALTSVTIPNSVTSIGEGAFYWCHSLTSITIPNSVTSIGSQAFNCCFSLTSVTIPNSVTSIGEGAFYWCHSLTSITIPNSVTSIGSQAFYDCYALTSVIIPNSVTSIGGEAFRGCSSLTSITIPNSVTSIGDYAFSGCDNLTSMVVENGNTTYDSRENCNAIIETATNTLVVGCKNTTIPNSVTSIGVEAFRGCRSLTSVTIPNSVTSIGERAFYGCFALTSIVVESGNSTYDSRENCNAIIETATNTLVVGCKNTTIPNSVTSIGDAAFEYCSALTSVTIGNSVTSIGDYAFSDCSSLTSVTIPNSVTSIGEGAFAYCSNLTSVTIGNSVTSIGEGTFCWCESLKTVICEAIEVPELGGGVFYGMPVFEATLYVPAQSLDDYKAAEQWKKFGTILPIEGESEEEIELQDTEMTIVFTNSEDNDSEIYRQTLTIKVPIAPTIAGFTFLYWQPVAEPITNEITIQAIYEADVPSSASEVYVNPANPAQKLLRNGQVYILQDGKTYTITGQRF